MRLLSLWFERVEMRLIGLWWRRWFGTDLSKPVPTALEMAAGTAGGVGKYLGSAPVAAPKRKEAPADPGVPKKKRKEGGGFGEFSGW